MKGQDPSAPFHSPSWSGAWLRPSCFPPTHRFTSTTQEAALITTSRLLMRATLVEQRKGHAAQKEGRKQPEKRWQPQNSRALRGEWELLLVTRRQSVSCPSFLCRGSLWCKTTLLSPATALPLGIIHHVIGKAPPTPCFLSSPWIRLPGRGTGSVLFPGSDSETTKPSARFLRDSWAESAVYSIQGFTYPVPCPVFSLSPFTAAGHVFRAFPQRRTNWPSTDVFGCHSVVIRPILKICVLIGNT